MICPFIVGTENIYKYIGNNSNGKDDKHNPEKYLLIRQNAIYPECYREQCPYFQGYPEACNKVSSLLEED